MHTSQFWQSAISTAKGGNIDELLPTTIHFRMPLAEWLDNPKAWSKEKFFAETAEFMYSIYGIGYDQDRHLLAMLADQVETYVNCIQHITKDALLVEQNNCQAIGVNPWFSIRDDTLRRIVALMSELGIGPKNRLEISQSQKRYFY